MLRAAFGDKELKNHANLIDVLIEEFPELQMSEDPVPTSTFQNEFKQMEMEIFSNDTYMLRIDGKNQFKRGPKYFLDDFYSEKKPSKINLENVKFELRSEYLGQNEKSLYDSEIMRNVINYYNENKYSNTEEQPKVSGYKL